MIQDIGVDFYFALLLTNVLFFLPMYLMNFKEQPNPLAFLFEKRLRSKNKFKMVYNKLDLSDPFRINYDYSAALTLLLLVKVEENTVTLAASLVFLASEAYLIYVSVLLFVFKRPAAFRSDLALIKSGLMLAKKNRWLIFLLTGSILIGLFFLAYAVTGWLVSHRPRNNWILVLFLLLITTLSFYNWRGYQYKNFHWRTVFSPLLHIIKNLKFSDRFKFIFTMERESFSKNNVYSSLKLKQKPNIVHVCIESYGAIIVKDENFYLEVQSLYSEYEEKLSQAGFHMSSILSTSPIFSGGSWLSYTSFMYGLKLDDLQLYDALFVSSESFEEYQSAFHILKKNGYFSALLCPMGGVDSRDVEWKSIQRSFQADLMIDWEKMNFQGNSVRFFNQPDRFCAPDQYALNFAYDSCKRSIDAPISLFYCTMNSHIPWESPVRIANDWREINNQSNQLEMTTDRKCSMQGKYLAAIRYQLETVFDFALKNEQDDMILTFFGDHQPPLLTNESAGFETPVHILSKSAEFNATFQKAGFLSGLDLSQHSNTIRHEAYLSIFANALNNAFANSSAEQFPIQPNGSQLFGTSLDEDES